MEERLSGMYRPWVWFPVSPREGILSSRLSHQPFRGSFLARLPAAARWMLGNQGTHLMCVGLHAHDFE